MKESKKPEMQIKEMSGQILFSKIQVSLFNKISRQIVKLKIKIFLIIK